MLSNNNNESLGLTIQIMKLLLYHTLCPYHSLNLSISSSILIHNNNHHQWFDVF